jgi:hypothetical protein
VRVAQASITPVRDQAPTGSVCVEWRSSTLPLTVKAFVTVELNSPLDLRSEILWGGSA